jgi:hypothetical protein
MSYSTDTHTGHDPGSDDKAIAGMRQLIQRLPEWQAQIEQRVRHDREFREICQDYQEVVQAIAGWRKRASPQADRCIRDYEMLLQELEAEALFCLWAGKAD